MTAALDLGALREAATIALERRAFEARTNFHRFANFCLRDNVGRAVDQAVIHRVMHLHVEHCWAAGLFPAILAPFAHGKTVQLPVGRTCYELGRDPNLRVKIVCNNDTKAMERTMGISSILLSPAYRLTFPGVRPVTKEKAARLGKKAKWTQHEIFLDRPGQAIDPSVQAAGVLSGGTGGRADLLVFDDVCDQKNSIDEPTMRQKVIENFENVWMQRLEPSGRALYVGTPWHQADLTHTLMNKSGWSVLKIWVSDDFERLDMEVYNPPRDYPLPRAAGRPNGDWFELNSTNLAACRHREGNLEVKFRNGGRYVYRSVPRSVYEELKEAPSPGRYLSQNVKDVYAHALMPEHR